MTKYHINKEGLPAVCRASKKPCPIGGDHYESKLDALAAADEIARESGYFLQSAKKSIVFHVGEKGAVEECPFRDGYCEVQPYGRFANVHSHQQEVIEGAAGVLREQVGASEAPEVEDPTPSMVKPPGRANPEELAEWEKELLGRDTEQPASPSRTPEGILLKGDHNDHFRYAGWSEAEIDNYLGSCGHSYPAGRSHVPWGYKGPAIPDGMPGNMVESERRKAARLKAEREAAAARTAQARTTYRSSTC